MDASLMSQEDTPMDHNIALEVALNPSSSPHTTSLSKYIEPFDKAGKELSANGTLTTNEHSSDDMPDGVTADLDVHAPSDSDSTVSEEFDDPSSRTPKVSERRRAQNMKFSSWLSQRAEQVTKQQVQTVIQNADEEMLSVRQLMAKQESNVIITDPRDYQVELFEKAKKQNIIAVLDTGSGKTLIAVLLLRHVLDQELEDRLIGKKPRISFFLVDSVTLVFQQFAVLECNLDHKIERFCGEMGCDLWDKRTWDKQFQENMVIVCTAEILYQCLMHSFISLDQINLLIFDEAHHAKKNHAYARIIKDFYIPETNISKRPKVFGMTASPVDARKDVVEAAKELEAMLHCQIATTADLSLLRMSVSRPTEALAPYSRLQAPYTTPLCAQLKSMFGDLEATKRTIAKSEYATSQLGEWCADHIWKLALEDEQARKIERMTERLWSAERQPRPVEQLDADIVRIRQAQDFVKGWQFPAPSSVGNGISSKVLLLKRYLDLEYERSGDCKSIVFVRRRYTARVLAKLFARIGTSYLRLGLLIGTRYGDAGDIKVSFREQVLTLQKFRKGEINCLFATSIAEEGLDIPDCNKIFRFDLYDTLIQYIQSRGRARHRNSTYVHFIEADNRLDLQLIKDVRQGEAVMRQFCEALPADRLLQGSDYKIDTALAKEKSMRRYTDPETGATLTYSSALVILQHFVGCLPHHDDAVLQPSYLMTAESKRYVCEVMLPEGSPVRSAVGRPSSNKALAKRSAAFEMCVLLRQGNHLDNNLMPTIKKYLPAMRNAHLALNMNKSDVYDMKTKPSIWEHTRGAAPKELFMTVLHLEEPADLGHSSQPLALLTRTPMPEFPPIPLYLKMNKKSSVTCTLMAKSLVMTALLLRKLNDFTLCMYKDIFNKKFEDNIPDMSYWIAPILNRQSFDKNTEALEALIDWPTLNFVHENDNDSGVKWTPQTQDSELANRYLVDKWDGGRRFFSVMVLPNLKPQDPVPVDAASHKYMNSILDYSVSLFSKSRARVTWSHDQPVILAERILHRLNWLEDYTEKENAVKTTAYVCPEPLKISTLPVSIASMGYLFSAILTRIESYLIALEACDIIGITVRPDLALEAMTKDSDNTEEHRSEQVHVQRGMGKNYERLEFIGDCFLKMATSISLFSKCPENDEFEYHVRRMEMICNKNLFSVALNKKLYQYIRTQGFSRRTWYPEGIKLLEGKGHTKTGTEMQKHRLGDKTIADVCEALIGAALLSYIDSGNMDMAVTAVSSLVSRTDHDVSTWAEYYLLYTKPNWQLVSATASQLDLAAKMEKEHRYKFRYPRLLRSAFMHPSYPSMYEKVPSYQRLEFLGDALLDMACINFLFHRHPDRDPQWLTEHKMAMVSNKFLAALAVKLGFHKHLRCGGAVIEIQVREFVAEANEAERESNGAPDYWTLTKNPPKALSDIIESYIGALFVDSEYDYGEVERFFEEHVRWFFEDMTIYDTFANNHPTTHLHNLLTLSFGCTNYRLMANEIPAFDGGFPRNVAVVMIHDQIIADGEASSGKNAKVKASQEALKQLQGIAPYEYRMRYGCNCGNPSDGGEGLLNNVGTAI